MEKIYLTEDELNLIREGNANSNNIKTLLGEIELHKYELLKQHSQLVDSFRANEVTLVEKYGADSVIDLKTGEVKLKE